MMISGSVFYSISHSSAIEAVLVEALMPPPLHQCVIICFTQNAGIAESCGDKSSVDKNGLSHHASLLFHTELISFFHFS